MTSRKYTAQDYRQMVCNLENNLKHGMERVVIASPKLIDMVRQASDTEEENAQLRARMETIRRECATHISMRCRSQCKIASGGIPKSLNGKLCYKCNVCDLTPEELAQTGTATEILCVARGEGEK